MGELDKDKSILTAGQMSEAEPDIYIHEMDAGDKIASDYYKNLEICVYNHLRLAVFKDKDFYVCVLAKIEKLLTALGKPTLRHYFIGLLACPKPNYQMNLYKYHKDLDALEEIWLLSDKHTCKFLEKNKYNLGEGEAKLLDYYQEYKKGNLFRLMKKLNGEKDDTPELQIRRKD
jgi:hypothetical protein